MKSVMCCDWTSKKREAVISRLLSLINAHVGFGVGVSIVLDDFNRLPAEDRELCADNPYALCAAQCMGLVMKMIADHNVREPRIGFSKALSRRLHPPRSSLASQTPCPRSVRNLAELVAGASSTTSSR